MQKAKITQVERMTHMHRQSPGSGDVIRIITDLPTGQNNSFYIDVTDKKKQPVTTINDGTGTTVDDVMTIGDEVIFDKQKLFQKEVIWNGRTFRQRGYSFDYYSPSLYTG